MDFFEKASRSFGEWYESWFGQPVGDIRPKDVLRKIVCALEDNRKEGLDNRIYVPNKFILQICLASQEEKDYLYSFLEREELDTALRKYLAQHKYFIRGPLDFTFEEIPHDIGNRKQEKITVQCRWDIRPTDDVIVLDSEWEEPKIELPEPKAPEDAVPGKPYEPYDEETVMAIESFDTRTISPPRLKLRKDSKFVKEFILNKPVITIGRSKRLDNSIFIEEDGTMSKRHAKITLTGEGFRIIDLNSTNGLWINDTEFNSPEGHLLKNGDIIRMGMTEFLYFDDSERPVSVAATAAEDAQLALRPRIIFKNEKGEYEDFQLASEVMIGRALSCGLRFDVTSVSRLHARIFTEDGAEYYIEDFGSETGTCINGIPIGENTPTRLRDGDRIQVGKVEIRFEIFN